MTDDYKKEQDLHETTEQESLSFEWFYQIGDWLLILIIAGFTHKYKNHLMKLFFFLILILSIFLFLFSNFFLVLYAKPLIHQALDLLQTLKLNNGVFNTFLYITLVYIYFFLCCLFFLFLLAGWSAILNMLSYVFDEFLKRRIYKRTREYKAWKRAEKALKKTKQGKAFIKTTKALEKIKEFEVYNSKISSWLLIQRLQRLRWQEFYDLKGKDFANYNKAYKSAKKKEYNLIQTESYKAWGKARRALIETKKYKDLLKAEEALFKTKEIKAYNLLNPESPLLSQKDINKKDMKLTNLL